MANDELRTIFCEELAKIDEIFIEQNLPVHRRPLEASILFIHVCVKEVSTGTKSEFIQGPHFSIIVNMAIDWYMEKYGDLAKAPKLETVSGIAIYHGQPVELTIPTVTRKVEKEGELAWIKFPDHREEQESYASFFSTKVNLESLSAKNLSGLHQQIDEVVALSRKTHISIMTASQSSGKARSMALTIWANMEKAITDIVSQKAESSATACWELHLCVEKAFKVFINQASGENAWGHDLDVLYKTAQENGLALDSGLLAKMPKWQQAISLRYSEAAMKPKDATQIYRTALEIVCQITSQLKRDYSIYNSSILIKNPGWAR